MITTLPPRIWKPDVLPTNIVRPIPQTKITIKLVDYVSKMHCLPKYVVYENIESKEPCMLSSIKNMF